MSKDIDRETQNDSDNEAIEDPSKGLTPLENALRKADIVEFMTSMLKRLKVDHGFRSI